MQVKLSNCDPARRNAQKVAEPQSKIRPIFDQWGVIPPSCFFLLIIVPGCLFHNFLQTKLLKVCEKAKFRAPFCGC